MSSGTMQVIIPLAVMIFLGIYIVSALQSSISLPYKEVFTANETISSSGSVPEVITVSNVYDGLKENSETIYVNDFDTNTVKLLTRDVNYTVISYETGQFNITSAPDVNSTSDSYLVSYTAKDVNDRARNTFDQVTNLTFNAMNLLTIMLVLIAAMFILALFRR